MSREGIDDDGSLLLIDAVPDPSAATNFVLMDASQLAAQLDPPIPVLVIRIGAQLVPGPLACTAMAVHQLTPPQLGRAVRRDNRPFAGLSERLSAKVSFPALAVLLAPRLRPRYPTFYA
jgi:hypothetical protein